MKKIIIYIILITLTVFSFGCNQTSEYTEKLNQYIEELTISSEVSTNFYLPRELNGEKDHVITWTSSNEEIISIDNIKTITGLNRYLAVVKQGDKDFTVTLTAVIDMIDGTFQEKQFVVTVKEDTSIKEAKIAYVKEVLAQYHNFELKESITLPVVTKEHGLEIVWSSSNNDILSTRGEYKAPEVDTNIEMTAVIKDAGKEIYREVIKFIAVNKNSIEKEIVLDFVSKFDSYAANWDSSYTERKVNNTDLGLDIKFNVVFSRANRQAAGNSISDRPVVAAKASTEYITIQLETGSIKTITFSLMQWTTKTLDNIHMEYFDGSTWVKCSDDSTIPGDVVSNTLPSNVTKVRLSVKANASKNTQLGLSSIQLELN